MFWTFLRSSYLWSEPHRYISQHFSKQHRIYQSLVSIYMYFVSYKADMIITILPAIILVLPLCFYQEQGVAAQMPCKPQIHYCRIHQSQSCNPQTAKKLLSNRVGSPTSSPLWSFLLIISTEKKSQQCGPLAIFKILIWFLKTAIFRCPKEYRQQPFIEPG